MNNHTCIETDYIPYICSREEYDQAIHENKMVEEKILHAKKIKKLLIRCSAWLFLTISGTGIFVFNSELITFSSLFIVSVHILYLKISKYL